MAKQIAIIQTRSQKKSQNLRTTKPITKALPQKKAQKQIIRKKSPSPQKSNKKPKINIQEQQPQLIKRTKSIEEVMKQAKNFLQKDAYMKKDDVIKPKILNGEKLIAERLRNQVGQFVRVTRNLRKQQIQQRSQKKIDGVQKKIGIVQKVKEVKNQKPQKIAKKQIKKVVQVKKPKQNQMAVQNVAQNAGIFGQIQNQNQNQNLFAGSVFNNWGNKQVDRNGFVDIVFCCDTIMTNMKAIRETVENVCKQVKQNEQKLVDVKFGFVWYYDHKSKVSNNFIQRIKDLCSAEEILKFIDEQKCYEFGEYPQEMEQDFESINNKKNKSNKTDKSESDLQNQMNKIQWRGQTDATDTLRYIYYIGEAPPDRVTLPGMQRQDYAQGCPCINNVHYQQMYSKFNGVESNAFKREVYYKCVVSGSPKIFYHKKI